MNFCDKCNKIVSDSEVIDASLGNLVVKTKRHVYKKIVNAYKNMRPGQIGYCPVSETVWCGNIREPNEQEYFIYYTLNI